MFHFAVLSLAVPVLGLLYLSSKTQIAESKVSAKLRLDKSKAGGGKERRSGFKFTDNNFAFFNTPMPRYRANSITFYEAEQMENKNEIQEDIQMARKQGNAVKQIETLARFYRSKDNAIQNVAVDYNNSNTLVQLRRNTGIPSAKRVIETIADHPALHDISAWVPHMKSVPIPHSMGRSYWRPVAHMNPGGYTHV